MSDETQAAFKKFAGLAFLYFGKDVNTLPADTLKLWMGEVGGYPPEFFAWALVIVKSLDSGRTVTTNLPKVVKELWSQWLSANPNRQERHEFCQCKNPLCQDGRFTVYQQDSETGILTERTAICAECKRLGREMAIGLTRSQAVHAGYFLPDEEVEAKYREQQSVAVAKAWERYAGLRERRFISGGDNA